MALICLVEKRNENMQHLVDRTWVEVQESTSASSEVYLLHFSAVADLMIANFMNPRCSKMIVSGANQR